MHTPLLKKLKLAISVPTIFVLVVSSIAGCLIGYDAGMMSGHIIMDVSSFQLQRKVDLEADLIKRTF